MNIMSSLILFAVFIIVYTIIIEIFTVLFRLTGITREKARTQVISLLTNSGFTTHESELILASKRRRRLAQITMLCGYSFSVVIVSVLVNIFLALNQHEVRSLLQPTLTTIAIIIMLILIMRLRRVRSEFDLLIERIGNRVMFGKHSNILVLIDVYKEKAMVEVLLDHIPACLDGVRLADSKLKESYGIQILIIRRQGETIDHIAGDTIVATGDSLLLFGDYKAIKEIFERPGHIET